MCSAVGIPILQGGEDVNSTGVLAAGDAADAADAGARTASRASLARYEHPDHPEWQSAVVARSADGKNIAFFVHTSDAGLRQGAELESEILIVEASTNSVLARTWVDQGALEQSEASNFLGDWLAGHCNWDQWSQRQGIELFCR